ncbi:hypothetical protein ACP8HZ_10555 [Francisella noatunensis]
MINSTAELLPQDKVTKVEELVRTMEILLWLGMVSMMLLPLARS